MTFIAGAGAEKAVVSLFLQLISPPLPLPGLQAGVAGPLLPQLPPGAPGVPGALRGELVAPVGSRGPGV